MGSRFVYLRHNNWSWYWNLKFEHVFIHYDAWIVIKILNPFYVLEFFFVCFHVISCIYYLLFENSTQDQLLYLDVDYQLIELEYTR